MPVRIQGKEKKLAVNKLAKKDRIVALDILRAAALFMISFYHWFSYKGTYVGVVVFFALSGYLFTGRQLTNRNVLDIWNATERRIAKIYPSLITVILISTVITLIINRGLEETYKQSVVASMFSYNNFYQIKSNLSYFDNFGMLLPLTHIWALSLQFQLYLTVPFLVLILKKLKMNNRKISAVFAVLSLASAIIMAVSYAKGEDLSKIYYSFSTRAFSFLIASAIAVFYQNRRITDMKEIKIIRILGIAGIVSLIHYSMAIDYTSPLNYYGYMYITSILISFTIVQLSRVDTHIFENRRLTALLTPVLRLGQHQYQYYLWQYPIMLFSRELFKWSKLGFAETFLFQLAVLVMVSETSYQLFENNKITGIIKRLWYEKVERKYDRQIFRNEKLKKLVFNYNLIFIILTALILMVSPVYENRDLIEMKNMQQSRAGEGKSFFEVQTEKMSEDIRRLTDRKNMAQQKNAEQKKIDSASVKAAPGILFIGDSVLELVRVNLEKKYPDAVIDTQIGRQFRELPGILEKYIEERRVGETVVIALGTNGAISGKDMEKTLQLLKGRQIYTVNVVVPHSWEKSVNRELEKVSRENGNVRLVDWYGLSKGKKEYFYNDGVHPKPEAAKKYANMISSALGK